MADHEEIHVAQFPGSMVGQIFAEQMEVTIRHHALEAGCFVVNATGWLTDAQRERISPDESLRKALTGGCFTAIVSPEGQHLAPPITHGEGILIADLDMALVLKRKRMMDSVGHYARPELLSLLHDDRPQSPVRAEAREAGRKGSRSDERDAREAAEADPDRGSDQRIAVLRGAAGRS
jgi:nitrilase